MSEKTLSVSEARRKFLELIRDSDAAFDRWVLTKNGRPKAVLLNYEDYEALIETVDILGDPSLVRELTKRDKEIKEGEVETKTHQEVFEDKE